MAVELLKLLSVAWTITVCAAAPVMTWAIGLVPRVGVDVAVAVHVPLVGDDVGAGRGGRAAGVDGGRRAGLGLAAGQREHDDGLRCGSLARRRGVGSGAGFGSGNATPVLHAHAHAALGGVAARSPGLAAPGSGLAASGMTSHGPAAGAVGRRLAEGGPAEGREVPGQHGRVEGERERLAAARDRGGDRGLRAGGLAGEVLAVGGRERAVEGAQRDVDRTPSALRVATTSWSAIESLSRSIRTWTPRSARCRSRTCSRRRSP